MSNSDSDPKDPHRLAELDARRTKALEMGGPGKIDRVHGAGKLTVRERIAALLDAGSFREVGLLARSDLPDAREKTPADGKVCGFGRIDGRPVYVSGDDVTVLAGSGGRVGVKKDHDAAVYAASKGYPCISLGDAGGARIPDIMGATGMMSMVYPIGGQPRDRQVPFVATILGECYGSPTWKASIADVVIQVKGAVMAVSGPPVLAAATGEVVTPEEIGGWQLHAKVTGEVDLFAEDERHCFELVRRVLSYLPSSADDLPPVVRTGDPPDRTLDDVLDVLPERAQVAYDMHKLVNRIFDAGSVLELKPLYDASLITALARLDGHTVGVLANNPMQRAGAMGPGACEKATAFICLCDSFHVPLVFLHDTPGFFVSKTAEERKMPLKIMTFIEALHHSTVPRLSVVVRKSYGMAHCNMSGGNMKSDALFAWPTADVSFMAPEAATNVVFGRKVEDFGAPDGPRAELIEQMKRMNAPWDAAGLGLFTDVIDPRETRRVLVESLARALGEKGDRGRSRRLLASWPRMT
ncbi:MAG TPA: carboxyl transferase domain-containing protein [Polyangiaceae bacterium]|jgi:acetyl-CoA carboxylase carboxyltransferase component|nr:carboxyl transferase domain-containing protein [Polyangiaceae bacterium]